MQCQVLGFLTLAHGQPAAPGTPGWLAQARQAQERQDVADFPVAEVLWREALRSAEEELGAVHEQTAVLTSALAGVLHVEGHEREAYSLALRSVEIAEASQDKRLIGCTLTRLGLVLSGLRQYARAEPLLRRSLAMFEESEGPDTFETAVARGTTWRHCIPTPEGMCWRSSNSSSRFVATRRMERKMRRL